MYDDNQPTENRDDTPTYSGINRPSPRGVVFVNRDSMPEHAKPGGMMNATDGLDYALGELDDSLTRLRHKLNTILLPDGGSPAAETAEKPVCSSLQSYVWDKIFTVRSMTDALNELTNRIDL